MVGRSACIGEVLINMIFKKVGTDSLVRPNGKAGQYGLFCHARVLLR
jgi:hypothetical protein